MFSFCVQRERVTAAASTFDWFTYDGSRPVHLTSGSIRKGQRFGVKATADGQAIQLLTVGAAQPQIISLPQAQKLARHIRAEHG